MKKLFALILALAMALSLVACGGKTTTEPEATEPAETVSTASGKVYYLNFKPEADEAWQALAAVYTEQTGVPVKVVTAASGSYSDTLTAEMAKSEAPTLYQIGTLPALYFFFPLHPEAHLQYFFRKGSKIRQARKSGACSLTHQFVLSLYHLSKRKLLVSCQH